MSKLHSLPIALAVVLTTVGVIALDPPVVGYVFAFGGVALAALAVVLDLVRNDG